MEDKMYSHRIRLKIIAKAIDFIKHDMSVRGSSKDIDKIGDEVVDMAKRFESYVVNGKPIDL